MKLRNKKTGEIGKPRIEYQEIYVDTENHLTHCYKTLRGMFEDWEDYEESKEYWYIDDAGVIQIDQVLSSEINMRKSIGNYFENREDAVKAVEKLKAWKRLKDIGFKLKGWYMPKNTLNIEIDGGFPKDVSLCDVMDDLDIVFGGEE